MNDEFNRFLNSREALKHLVDCKFFGCDGNHRRIAWIHHITRLHSREIKWHYCVDSIILDTRNRIGFTMQVMHDVNKYVFVELHLHLLIVQENFFPSSFYAHLNFMHVLCTIWSGALRTPMLRKTWCILFIMFKSMELWRSKGLRSF